MARVIPLSPDQGLYEGIRRYATTQQRSADLANASTDAMLQNAVRAKEAPEQDYRRYRAKGAADIKNYKDAEAAGLPVGGKQAAVPSLRKSAFDFRRGLQDGGITNNYGLAAFMGHAQNESQFNPMAARVTETEDSHGIMQTNRERNTQRVNWIKQNGGQPDDPYWQGRYAAWENTEGPESKYNVNKAKSLEEANRLMAGTQRYKDPAQTTIRLATSQAWLKKMTGEKPGPIDPNAQVAGVGVGAEGEGENINHEYPNVDPKTGKRFTYRHYNATQLNIAKQNHYPGVDRIEFDPAGPVDPKTKSAAYRLYDPNPATPVPVPTPVPTTPDPVPTPQATATLPAQAQAPVQPVIQPVAGADVTEPDESQASTGF